MSKTRRMWLVALVVAAALLAAAAPAAAKATQTEVWFVEGPLSFVGPPAKEWVDEAGVLHVRGHVSQRPFVDGDFQGYAEFAMNLNMDLATGEGVGWGPVTLYVASWAGRQGTFEGHFTIKFPLGADTGTRKELLAHGTGDMAGMRLVGDFSVLNDQEMLVSATVLDPHGE